MLTPVCFIVGPERRYLFGFVPKSACTNWKCVLRHEHGQEDYLNPRLAHDMKNGGLPFLSEEKNPWQLLRDPQVKKFTCVRNPYTRVLSAYLNKIEPFVRRCEPDHLRKGLLKVYEAIDEFRALCLPEKPEVDFECFLTWLDYARPGDPFAKNQHWRPQTQIIGNGQVDFDFIARFENLATDAPELLRRMGSAVEFPSQEQVKFPPTGADQKTRGYYTPLAVELVRRIYGPDFDYLGYDPDRQPLVD